MTEINEFVKNLSLVITNIEKSPDDFFDKTKYFEYVWKFQNSLLFPYSIYNEFNFCLSVLNEKVSRKFNTNSLEEIKKIFIDFLFDIIYSNQNQKWILSTIHKKSTDLFKKVKNIDFFQYLVIIPLVNIKSETPLKIEKCEITHLTKIKIRELNKLYKINLTTDPDYNEENLINEIKGNSRFPTIAITEVIATDTDKAMRMALDQTEQALNILRFYMPDFKGLIKGEEVFEIKRTFIIAKTNTVELSYPSELCNMPLNPDKPDQIIDRGLVSKLFQEYFEEINELFNKPQEKLSPLERDLIIAISWIGDASKDQRSIHKLIKYIIVLDTLLVQGRSDKSEFTARSIASIINKNSPKDMTDTYYKVKSYYKLRNQVMHAGLINIDNENFEKLRDLVVDLICLLFICSKKYSKFLNIKDLQSTIFPINDDFFNKLT